MIPLQYLSQFHLFESLWVWNHHHMILCKLTRRQMISFRVLKVFLEFMILKQIIKRYGNSFMSSNSRYLFFSLNYVSRQVLSLSHWEHLVNIWLTVECCDLFRLSLLKGIWHNTWQRDFLTQVSLGACLEDKIKVSVVISEVFEKKKLTMGIKLIYVWKDAMKTENKK